MAKRLTDSDKWDDPWFLDLPNEYKLIWLYILDKCDHAGIWKVNKRMVQFCLNFEPRLDDFVAVSDGRVVIISSEKWFIPKFLDFQYKSLGPENKIYKSIEASLSKEGISIPHISPINGGKETRKDKEKEVKGIVKGKPTIEEVKDLFREKGFPAEAEKFFDYYEANGWRVGRNPMRNWRSAVANWIRNGSSYGKLESSPKKRERKRDPFCTTCDQNGFLPDGKMCWCWKPQSLTPGESYDRWEKKIP